MKLNLTTLVALALLATAANHQAQKPVAPKAAEATAVLEPDVSLRFAVAGLTKDNAVATKTALTALTVPMHVCEPCVFEQTLAGHCPKCQGPLQAAQKPLLGAVMPAPDESSISLKLNPRHVARLSEIEATLKKSAVTIDHAKLPLPGRIILVVKGGAADRVASVQKALLDAKLFDEVTASFDAPSSEIRIRVRCLTSPAPMRAAVATAIEAQKLQLADVLFGQAQQG